MRLRRHYAQIRANMCALPNGLFDVMIRLARSYRLETNWKNKFAASASNGM